MENSEWAVEMRTGGEGWEEAGKEGEYNTLRWSMVCVCRCSVKGIGKKGEFDLYKLTCR